MDLPMRLSFKLLTLTTPYLIADEILYRQSIKAFSASEACHSGRAVQSADPSMLDSRSSMKEHEPPLPQILKLNGSPTRDLCLPSSDFCLVYSLWPSFLHCCCYHLRNNQQGLLRGLMATHLSCWWKDLFWRRELLLTQQTQLIVGLQNLYCVEDGQGAEILPSGM